MIRIKRYILSILLCAGILALHTGCSLIPDVLLPEEKVSLSYYNAPASTIAEYLSEITDLPVSLDPALKDITITLVTTTPATLAEAEKLITAVFEVQNCIVTREKKSITIKKAQ